ncbi:MAG: DinB family protein [Gemmatimonadaceae bacterium]
MSIFTNPAGATAREGAATYIAALMELLGDRDPIAVQEELLGAVRELTAGLSEDDLTQPERAGKWSILQVVEHLTDQELVNGFRLRSIVAEVEPPLRGYDQDLWAAKLRYGSAGLEPVLEELRALRNRNLRLYRSLSEPELDRVGLHDERGPESARRLRALTAAHDLLHRRQIARIRASLGRPVS